MQSPAGLAARRRWHGVPEVRVRRAAPPLGITQPRCESRLYPMLFPHDLARATVPAWAPVFGRDYGFQAVQLVDALQPVVDHPPGARAAVAYFALFLGRVAAGAVQQALGSGCAWPVLSPAGSGRINLCATSSRRLSRRTAHGTLRTAPKCPGRTAKADRVRSAWRIFERASPSFWSTGVRTRCAPYHPTPNRNSL